MAKFLRIARLRSNLCNSYKKKRSIKEEAKEIYSVHDLPQKRQSDNGGEFKKHVKEFCTTDKVKMVRCRRYHLKAQGKLERSYCVLRRKIH